MALDNVLLNANPKNQFYYSNMNLLSPYTTAPITHGIGQNRENFQSHENPITESYQNGQSILFSPSMIIELNQLTDFSFFLLFLFHYLSWYCIDLDMENTFSDSNVNCITVSHFQSSLNFILIVLLSVFLFNFFFKFFCQNYVSFFLFCFLMQWW